MLEPHDSNKVFQGLYELGKRKLEKSVDTHKKAIKQKEKDEIQKCTFKPDFSKTQTITEKYLKKR